MTNEPKRSIQHSDTQGSTMLTTNYDEDVETLRMHVFAGGARPKQSSNNRGEYNLV